MQASSGTLVGRSNTSSYRNLRTDYVQTVGASAGTGGSNSRSQSRSIALESFVNNQFSDVDKDGSHTRLDDSFALVSYGDVEVAEHYRFTTLINRESGWRRSIFHKGLLSNIVFVVIMIVGVALIEIYKPDEGPRGFRNVLTNNASIQEKDCVRDYKCILLRIVRSVGVFGFFGGIINWLFIELLFRKVPLLCGSGVIQRHHMQILSGFRLIILDILFDIVELQDYFSNRGDRVRDILQLNAQFSGLLNSQSTNEIITDKIDSALDSPQGFTLCAMGVDKEEVKAVLLHHIRLFINDIAPEIYKRLSVPGITDGDGLKTEIKRILEPRLSRLTPQDVSKIIGAMLRKHLSWLIIWGNIFGGVVGLLNEALVASAVLLGSIQ